MAIQEQSTTGAGLKPNTDDASVATLARVAQLVVPTVDWVKGETDDGSYYYHVGDPKGLINYLIEPDEEGQWHAEAAGMAGLLRPFQGPTARAVAWMAATALTSYLSLAARTAAALMN